MSLASYREHKGERTIRQTGDFNRPASQLMQTGNCRDINSRSCCVPWDGRNPETYTKRDVCHEYG